MRGQRDDRHMPAGWLFVASNQADRFQAVQFRHLDVHQDQIERAPRSQGQCFFSIISLGHSMTFLSQDGHGQFTVNRMVFSKENAQTGSRRLDFRRGFFRFDQPPCCFMDAQCVKNGVEQFDGLHWFRQVRSDTGCLGANRIAWPGRQLQHQHRGLRQVRTPLDLLGQRDAVHVRHHRVHDDELESPAGLGRRLQFSERRVTAADGHRVHAPALKHLLQDHAAGLVIVHHQRAQTA